jgi:chromosomal replication initiator protein
MKAQTIKRQMPSPQGLDRFVVLPENRFAQRAIRRLAASEIEGKARRKPFPLLYLHGAPGTGKSHLVQGFLERVIGESSDRSGRCIPARDLARLLCGTLAEGIDAMPEFRSCDLLVIEDIQHLPASAAESLASLIDHRRNRHGSVVVTSAGAPALLTQLPMRLTSRLISGLVVGLAPLSRSSRLKLARALIEQSGLHVTEQVVEWLARQPTGGARPILGDLARLEQLSRLMPPPLDLAMVKAKLPVQPEEACLPLERVARCVAGHFGLKLNQLKGRERQRHLLWPRHVGMYFARQLTDSSLVQIGAYFGGYDHATVLHACRRVEKSMAQDERLTAELKLLQATLF